MNAQQSLLSSLVQPQDHLHLEAIKERIESDGSRSSFQKWLQSQDRWELKRALEEEQTSAQEFLYQQAGDISGGIPSFLVSIALAMIEKSGWDTQLMRGFEDKSRNSNWVASDETFLEWLTVREGHGTSLPETLNWPTTLEEFISFDEQYTPERDHEWLTALFVASGANPWTMQRKKRRNLALQNCILYGHPKICTQLLSLPGAPSLRSELDKTHCFDEENTISRKLFGGRYDNNRNQNQEYLPLILQDSPGLKLTPQEMAKATPEVLKKSLENPSHTPEELKETEEQLKIHHKERWFGAIGLVERLALLPKNKHWPDDLA